MIHIMYDYVWYCIITVQNCKYWRIVVEHISLAVCVLSCPLDFVQNVDWIVLYSMIQYSTQYKYSTVHSHQYQPTILTARFGIILCAKLESRDTSNDVSLFCVLGFDWSVTDESESCCMIWDHGSSGRNEHHLVKNLLKCIIQSCKWHWVGSFRLQILHAVYILWGIYIAMWGSNTFQATYCPQGHALIWRRCEFTQRVNLKTGMKDGKLENFDLMQTVSPQTSLTQRPWMA